MNGTMGSRRYAVFLDIDDTLMSRGVLPQKNIDAIARARKLGNKVFLNTGRAYSFIPEKIMESIRFDGVVAGIGSYVRYGNEILRSVTFTERQLKMLVGHYLTTESQCHVEGETRMFYIHPRDPKGKTIIRSSDDFSVRYPDSRISKFSVDGRMTAEERKMLADDFVCWQHENYYEFARKGCNKASGMRVVMDRLGWSRSASIAMGDSKNDIEMMKYAGISIAMGNSPDRIKELCDDVTASAEEAGVAAALAATQGGYDPRRIDVKQLQQILIDEGNILDVDV